MTGNLHPLTTVVYVAGPTRKVLRAELASALKYCHFELGYEYITGDEIPELLDSMMSRDTNPPINMEEQHPGRPGHQVEVYFDRLDEQSFDDTATRLGTRTGLADALNQVSELESDDRELVVARADRLIDASGTVSIFEELSDEFGVDIHVTDQGFTLHAGTEVTGPLKRALVLLCDETGATSSEITKELKHPGGRPPKGFTSEGGELVPTERYDEICGILQAVADGHVPKRQAASKIGCARKTVDTMLDKPQLYALD